MEQHVIFITGTSKGIGLATVNLFLKNNWIVCGFGRTRPEIDHEHFFFFETQIGDLDSVSQSIQKALMHTNGQVNVLLNNAGFGTFGSVTDLPMNEWDEMFQVNVHGLMYAIRNVVPAMKRQQSGHIINISSIAGLNGVVNASGYCATKYAVRGISHALYAELRNDGIKVTCIYPGSVKTNFFDNVPSVTLNDQMLMPEDVAESIWYLANTSPNFLPVDFEIRPLQPKK
jgi:NADP-dependent 3-hydroxy acid dehydrogenase YdfG